MEENTFAVSFRDMPERKAIRFKLAKRAASKSLK